MIPQDLKRGNKGMGINVFRLSFGISFLSFLCVPTACYRLIVLPVRSLSGVRKYQTDNSWMVFTFASIKHNGYLASFMC